MQRTSLFSFKDSVIISLSIFTMYLVSPYFKNFIMSFKNDVNDRTTQEIEMENLDKPEYGPNPDRESEFSDISTSHVEEFKFQKLFD